MPDPAPLRRNRDFQLLWIGQAASALGSRASSVAYPLLVLALTGSPAQAGLVGFAATIPYLLVQLPAGRPGRPGRPPAGDDGLRRGPARGAGRARGRGRGRSSRRSRLIAAVALVEGCLTVVFNLAELSAVQLLVPSTQLEPALAQNEARVRGAGLLGQPLGGALFGLGRAVPFAADAASYAASLVTLAAIRRPLVAPRRRRAPAPRGRDGGGPSLALAAAVPALDHAARGGLERAVPGRHAGRHRRRAGRTARRRPSSGSSWRASARAAWPAPRPRRGSRRGSRRGPS